MEHQSRFLTPGADGEPVPDAGLWRKGLVYTRRSGLWPSQNYRITVGFKKGIGSERSLNGYQDLYRRVATIADHRISQFTCPQTAGMPRRYIVGHGWRSLTDNIAAAFITLGLRCSNQSGVDEQEEPSAESLLSPGGATLEELASLAPQHADEIYNEFDFSDPLTPDPDFITLSYGESVAARDAVDFQPFVDRAETFARSYRMLLQTFGEAGDGPFRTKRREWFLASETFVTVHICFGR